MRFIKTNMIAIIALIVLILIILVYRSPDESAVPSSESNTQTTTSEPKSKVVAPDAVSVKYKDFVITASNQPQEIGKVVATKNNVIVWQKQFSTPEINKNLETDVQVIVYTINALTISTQNFRDILIVVQGTGMDKKTYYLDPRDGKVIDISQVSPELAQ